MTVANAEQPPEYPDISSPSGAKVLAALYEAGVAHLRAGRALDAQGCCQLALAIAPDHADSLHLMGLLSLNAKQYDDAVEWTSRAIRSDPKPVYLTSLGTALLAQARFEDALQVFDKAVQLKPDDADLWKSLGLALSEAGRPADAILTFQQALRLNPRDWDAAYRIAACLRRLCRDEEALPWLDKALELHPDRLIALNSKAGALLELRRFDEAIATYLRMKVLVPDNFAIERRIEHIHLLTGNMEAGWARRETQWKARVPPDYYPKINQPIWLGEETIEGKTLLIYADEGLGDTIHFARYVPMVAAQGARVILVVDDALRPLLSALPGVSQCLSKSGTAAAWPPFDMHSPICGLPLAFPRSLDTIPSATPYLPPPEQSRVQAWEDRLGPHDKLRVGLAWSGNPAHENDHNRSIPLRLFSNLLTADATFVSLTKDPNPRDKPVLQESSIVDLTTHLTDFAETAALVSCLDLVITVDTSMTHLSGALARPTWILLPYTPDYRWLLGRDDSPWYPTAKLFRQNECRDYASVLKRVQEELETRIGADREFSSTRPTPPDTSSARPRRDC